MIWTGFANWFELLGHIQNGGAVYYLEPFDSRPTFLRQVKIMPGLKLECFPAATDCDPFTADEAGHFDRFVKSVRTPQYPVRRYENAQEPQVGDCVRMPGTVAAFSDCVITEIAPAVDSVHQVTLARPFVVRAIGGNGGIHTDRETWHVTLDKLVSDYWLLTTGISGKADRRWMP